MQPISTAILSFGMSGQVFHAPFITTHPGFHFTAVWERSKNIAAQSYEGVTTYRSLEELLADERIELVIVNTPNATHFDYCKKAIEAGKHVIVEKPFTTTVAEAEELIRLAGEAGIQLSVFQNRRWDSDFKTVNRVIGEGWLGRLVEAEFHFDRYKEELSPKQHKEVPGPGTGVLYDLGSHIIDQCLHLFGMPQSLFAQLRTVRKDSSIDDFFDLYLAYESLSVRLHSSYLVREPLPAYIVHGSKGSFIKSRGDVQEAELLAGKTPGCVGWGAEIQPDEGLLNAEEDEAPIRRHVTSEHGDYTGYFETVYRAIRDGEEMAVSGKDGLNVIRIIEAAIESSKTGRSVLF